MNEQPEIRPAAVDLWTYLRLLQQKWTEPVQLYKIGIPTSYAYVGAAAARARHVSTQAPRVLISRATGEEVNQPSSLQELTNNQPNP